MLNYSSERPQRKKRHRPEYPLIPRVAPNIRVYIPEKPVHAQRSAEYQHASQHNATANEMRRRADKQAHVMLSEAAGREAPDKGGIKMHTDTVRYATPEDMGKEEKNFLAKSRMAKKTYVPRHAAPEDMDDMVLPESPVDAYMPRHAAPEDETPAVASKTDTSRTKPVHRPSATEDTPIDMPEMQRGNAAVLRVVDESVYGEEDDAPGKTGYSASHNRKRHANEQQDQPAERSLMRTSKKRMGTATPLRVVDESVYDGAGYETDAASARREIIPLRNRPYRMGEGQVRVKASVTPGEKAAKRPRRRKVPSHRPASAYAEKPVSSGKRKGRIILLCAGLGVTIALLIGLMLPGGWLTREVPPLSTVTTSQLFTDEGGDENGAGVVSTPAATPDATTTSTATMAAAAMPTSAVSATATAKATATATATAKPTATPKPTTKATVTPTATPTTAPTATSTTAPTATSTTAPTATPTAVPTQAPAVTPTTAPTTEPTTEPSSETTTP